MMMRGSFIILATVLSNLFFATSAQRVEVLVWMHNDGTRILGTYYDRTYKAIYLRDGCPPAVNDFHCADFVSFIGDCPVYECNGVLKREPCNFDGDCQLDGICVDLICTYPGVLIAR
ncbi:hypothetical protein M514_01668 [Trichuris suis]|nr:hypothetical protein M514_01668 [Trichuris suis]KHJ49224.1 hypothetical protein D918_00345 [Trichuris suis]